jgi:hypothetical protein
MQMATSLKGTKPESMRLRLRATTNERYKDRVGPRALVLPLLSDAAVTPKTD